MLTLLTAANSTGYQKFLSCSSISMLLFRPLLRRCAAAAFVNAGALPLAAAAGLDRVEADSPLLARRARSSASCFDQGVAHACNAMLLEAE